MMMMVMMIVVMGMTRMMVMMMMIVVVFMINESGSCISLPPPLPFVSLVSFPHWGTADAELVGAQGYQRFPLYEPGVEIYNMLCLLPACKFPPFRFILLHFLQNFSKQRLRNVWNCEKTLT